MSKGFNCDIANLLVDAAGKRLIWERSKKYFINRITFKCEREILPLIKHPKSAIYDFIMKTDFQWKTKLSARTKNNVLRESRFSAAYKKREFKSRKFKKV